MKNWWTYVTWVPITPGKWMVGHVNRNDPGIIYENLERPDLMPLRIINDAHHRAFDELRPAMDYARELDCQYLADESQRLEYPIGGNNGN